MHFVFWQNILSPHQAPFLRSLADLGHGVTVVASEAMTADRLALGWNAPNLGQARVVIGPGVVETKRLIESSPKDAIHVMAGARWTALGHQALRQCLASKRRIGILTEAPDPRGLLGCGRWAKYTVERYTKGFHYDFVLAMGEMGVRWFRRCGYPARTVFPFAYVTEPAPLAHANDPASAPVLFYAGQFIARKGLDILLRAFAAAPSKDAQLHLLGDGPEKQQLQGSAQVLGIQNRVLWLPKRDSTGVQLEMEKADVTLLPSRHDGWGAVVNESLMVGTPVICSAACGAAELVRQPWLGTVFRTGRVDDLAKALKHWIDLGPRSPAERERILNWASCISGQAVAKYFVNIMDHIYSNSAPPVAPWRVSLGTTGLQTTDYRTTRP
jgi:glycosyltransferase involved in cell wall biosynthesis